LVDRSNCIKFILIGYFKVSVINQILFETLWCEFSNLIDLCFLFHHFSNKILIFQHKFTHDIRWLVCWLCTLLGLKVSKQYCTAVWFAKYLRLYQPQFMRILAWFLQISQKKGIAYMFISLSDQRNYFFLWCLNRWINSCEYHGVNCYCSV